MVARKVALRHSLRGLFKAAHTLLALLGTNMSVTSRILKLLPVANVGAVLRRAASRDGEQDSAQLMRKGHSLDSFGRQRQH